MKVGPYTLSAMVNMDSKYSLSSRAVKYIASTLVNIVDRTAVFHFPDNILWYASVTMTPELRKNRGCVVKVKLKFTMLH